MGCRSFGELPKLRCAVEASAAGRSCGGRTIGACGFESGGRSRRAGDRREEQGGGELEDGTSPLRRLRLQPADGEEREAEDRGRPVPADAGPRPVEPAAQESPPRGGEAEARPREGDPANALDPRREPGADRLESWERSQHDQERGEERRQGTQQGGGDRL